MSPARGAGMAGVAGTEDAGRIPVGSHPGAGQAPGAAEACPLCGAPLAGEQDWCLSCGAAARTRLSATPNWKVPIAGVAVVVVLLLGVLAAALISLSHGSGPAPAALTVTVAPRATGATTGAAGATTPATGATTGATAPGAGTTTPGTGATSATTPAGTTATPKG